jgi:hypothetical protein
MCELSALHLTTLAEHILPMHRLQKLFIVHTGCAINVIIQNFIEDFLSEEILKSTIQENVQTTIKFKDGNLTLHKKS